MTGVRADLRRGVRPGHRREQARVVDRPQVDIQQIGTGKNLQFTCEVFVKPDVTLGEYKGVEVKREHTLVTEDEVNAEIEKERNKQAAGSPLTTARLPKATP